MGALADESKGAESGPLVDTAPPVQQDTAESGPLLAMEADMEAEMQQNMAGWEDLVSGGAVRKNVTVPGSGDRPVQHGICLGALLPPLHSTRRHHDASSVREETHEPGIFPIYLFVCFICP
jgi:hypothetical protein